MQASGLIYLKYFFRKNPCKWDGVATEVIQWLSTLRLKYAHFFTQKMCIYHNLHQTPLSCIYIDTGILTGAATALCDLGDHEQAP